MFCLACHVQQAQVKAGMQSHGQALAHVVSLLSYSMCPDLAWAAVHALCGMVAGLQEKLAQRQKLERLIKRLREVLKAMSRTLPHDKHASLYRWAAHAAGPCRLPHLLC